MLATLTRLLVLLAGLLVLPALILTTLLATLVLLLVVRVVHWCVSYAGDIPRREVNLPILATFPRAREIKVWGRYLRSTSATFPKC